MCCTRVFRLLYLSGEFLCTHASSVSNRTLSRIDFLGIRSSFRKTRPVRISSLRSRERLYEYCAWNVRKLIIGFLEGRKHLLVFVIYDRAVLVRLSLSYCCFTSQMSLLWWIFGVRSRLQRHESDRLISLDRLVPRISNK